MFTLNVTATEELADNSVIEVKNIVAASAETVGYYGEDISASVVKTATPTGISGVNGNVGMQAEGIYNIGGVRMDNTKKGVNIIRKADGTTIKVYRK